MLFEYETNRLVLKVLKPEAAPLVLDFYERDKALFEHYEPDRVPQFYTLDFQKNTLRCEYNLAMKMLHVRFYIFRKGAPQTIIGTISFRNIARSLYSSCEVGYKFSSAFHHQGYASEALEKAIDVMFTEEKLHRIMAWVLPDNQPSLRLLNSLGFVREGISRDHMYLHGHWADHVQYSLLSPVKTPPPR